MRSLPGILLILSLTAARAEDISGTWQGASPIQHVLKIRKAAGGLRGEFYNLGEEASGATRDGNPVSAIAVSGQTVKFSLDRSGGAFEGRLDGNSITGSWQNAYGPPQPLTFTRAGKATAWAIDPSPHRVRLIEAQKGVKLEVLDWGGSGPPLVFLAGLGNSAHAFDSFAPRFTGRHHVYAITRRGFGLSDAPPATDENYDADRLGDDVLAVIDTLKLDRPVLAGHSIAGEELSSVGTRHPEKIAGLVYLDAVRQYSFYDPSLPDLSLDGAAVRRGLDRIFDVQGDPTQLRASVAELQASLPRLQTALQDTADSLGDVPAAALPQAPQDLAGNRIFTGTRRYGPVAAPVLALLAMPRRCQPNCDKPFMQRIMAADAARADFFEKNSPRARVVRIANASHFIWRSNPAEVEREMNAFMDGLR